MSEVIYAEQQRFRQWWLWLVVLGTSFYAGSALINRGRNGILEIFEFFFIVLGLPLLFLILRLKTTVSDEKVELEFSPVWTRVIPVDDITSVEAVTYRPLLHYGGWGIKFGPGRGWAYNVSGNEGVQLRLSRGRPVLIGSKRSEELAAAIESVMTSS